jgi:hypothetical protein
LINGPLAQRQATAAAPVAEAAAQPFENAFGAVDEGFGAGCPAPLPALEQWSGNATLNGIRSAAPGEDRVLVRRGQRSDAVQLVQQGIRAWGCEEQRRDLLPGSGADADFGPETESAVREFQGTTGIPQDGLVGPVTLSRLDAFVAFGTIPEFPSVSCKVIPPGVPDDVVEALADRGFAASADFQPSAGGAGETAVAGGIAGVPILCQVGKRGGGGKKAPAGICAGRPKHVESIGNATFALCDFINGSRMSGGAVPLPTKGNQVGLVEMRALGIALFGTVGFSIPTTGPGSSESDWEHGFIQTVRSMKYTAIYQRGWRATREVSGVRRDASGSNVPAPWYSNQNIPAFLFRVGNQTITVPGPIGLGPESIGKDPVGILDDPHVIFSDAVPINSEPECPCSFLQTIEMKGDLDTWLVVTPAGKGQAEGDLAFLQHAAIAFDLKADKSSAFAVQGSPSMTLENGKGTNSPVLTGPLANEDIRKSNLQKGAPCPRTIPGIKCPVESPKGG